MSKFATNSWQAREALVERKAYATHGSMYAVAGPTLPTGHRLPIEWQRRYLRDEIKGIAYTVVSYNTPIAWVLTDGTVVKVDHKWSITTSGHQGMLYALDASENTKVGIADGAQRERQAERDRRAQRRGSASVTGMTTARIVSSLNNRTAAHESEVFGGMRSTPEDYDDLISSVQGMLVR